MALSRRKMVAIKASTREDDLFTWVEEKIPRPRYKEILIKVEYFGINRVDYLQMQGKYPLPSDYPDTLGVEASGTIVAIGNMVSKYRVGDKVCALLDGGAYAEYALCQEGNTMMFEGISTRDMAAIPEAFVTSYQAIHHIADVNAGDWVLVHAAAGSIGTTIIMMASKMGANVIASCSTQKYPLCKRLGAKHHIDPREINLNFATEIARITDGAGVNILIDTIGTSYFEDNLQSMATDGTWVLLGLLGGGKSKMVMDLSTVLFKRIRFQGSTLRTRPQVYKKALITSFIKKYGSHIEDKKIRPIIDEVVDWTDLNYALDKMITNKSAGKIVCKVT